MRRLVAVASREDDLVLDPFMGVGSTGCAAMELGRRFVGFEINPAYFNAADKRMSEWKL